MLENSVLFMQSWKKTTWNKIILHNFTFVRQISELTVLLNVYDTCYPPTICGDSHIIGRIPQHGETPAKSMKNLESPI